MAPKNLNVTHCETILDPDDILHDAQLGGVTLGKGELGQVVIEVLQVDPDIFGLVKTLKCSVQFLWQFLQIIILEMVECEISFENMVAGV